MKGYCYVNNNILCWQASILAVHALTRAYCRLKELDQDDNVGDAGIIQIKIILPISEYLPH